jgi:hypothetical protein
MIKTAWRLFLAQSYALAFSAVLLSQPMGFLAWFGGLPWLYWGTDLLEAMVYQQAPDAGSVWLGLFVVQVVVGFLWLLSWAIFEVMALIYNAAVKRVEQERRHLSPVLSTQSHLRVCNLNRSMIWSKTPKFKSSYKISKNG